MTDLVSDGDFVDWVSGTVLALVFNAVEVDGDGWCLSLRHGESVDSFM